MSITRKAYRNGKRRSADKSGGAVDTSFGAAGNNHTSPRKLEKRDLSTATYSRCRHEQEYFGNR